MKKLLLALLGISTTYPSFANVEIVCSEEYQSKEYYIVSRAEKKYNDTLSTEQFSSLGAMIMSISEVTNLQFGQNDLSASYCFNFNTYHGGLLYLSDELNTTWCAYKYHIKEGTYQLYLDVDGNWKSFCEAL